MPVGESAFGKDPIDPVTSSFIPDMIKKTTDAPVFLYGCGRRPEADAQGIHVFDAGNNEDIRKVFLAIPEEGRGLMAGAAGLATIMADYMHIENRAADNRCRPLLIGDLRSMEYAAAVAESASDLHLRIRAIQEVKDALFEYGTIDVLDMGLIPSNVNFGDPKSQKPFGVGACALGGEASFRYVEKLIMLALENKVDATVTNALSKEAINTAGHHYSGHTEIYAEYTKTKD